MREFIMDFFRLTDCVNLLNENDREEIILSCCSSDYLEKNISKVLKEFHTFKGDHNNDDPPNFEKKISYFDYSLIPDYMMKSINLYVHYGKPLGGFLYKVFTNDLNGAIGAADDINTPLIPVYVRYIYNELPCGCNGSKLAVSNWMEKMNQESESKMIDYKEND